ncbi:MAG: flagellar hook basal-body protein [Alphaproteobacteria bacterium]|nr:flagellar hook basal-body protein [Alphaproteobacteria bacterium]
MALENASAIALSRQMVLRRQMDTVANNIANSQTPSYKSESLMFIQHLITNDEGKKLHYVEDIAEFRNMDQGPFTETGSDLDVAISGEGFLVVDGPNGPLYTRNGRMTLDATGRLVTNGGLVIQGGGVIPPDASKVSIATDGTVSIERLGGDNSPLNEEGLIGTLEVVTFDNLQNMEKIGNGLYRTNQRPNAVEDVELLQGMFEESNVQPILQMTRMIQVHRAYESIAKLSETEHQLERDAVDKLTRQV